MRKLLRMSRDYIGLNVTKLLVVTHVEAGKEKEWKDRTKVG